MRNDNALTRSLGTKVTAAEEAAVKATAERLDLDVSAFVRRAVLHELSDEPVDAAEAMLQLYVRTMETSLELGEAFTVDRFRQLCAEVKASCNEKPVKDDSSEGTR
jgi:hypothetical protein